MARKWAPTLLVLLMVTNGLWIYKFFDRSVTFDYQSVAIERHQRDKRLASEIVVHVFADCRVEDIERRLAPFQKEHLVQRKGDTVFVDDVGLDFRNNKLVKLLFSSEYASEPPMPQDD